ncbi:MAG: hypothetical protein QOD06_2556 [Candidatus Binatota bacterium]|nr:hypothetical protein [Candidatus Binatota bacterium]
MTVRSVGFALAAVLATGSGCGYHFAGMESRLPAEVRTVALGPIANDTREVGLEKILIEALEDEITGRGRLDVVPAGRGDAVLSGKIRSYDTRPVSFTRRDEALQYQLSVIVDLELRKRDDGKVLWKTRGLREIEDYSAVPGVVVTQSSQFQQQTLNARDLGGFTDIQLSEGQRREANERMVEDMSREIYNQMMEDF